MITSSQAFTAGQTVKFSDLGNFVRLLSAPANVTLRTYKNGVLKSESVGVTTGYAEEFEQTDAFDTVEIYSATAQTIQVSIRYGSRVYYDTPPTGSVSITSLTPTRATGSNAAATVTNASAQLVASNASRNYLLIQNKDAVGNIYINFGSAATVANGIKIPPGASYELNCNILTAAINAIGDIASNANIVVVTG